MFSASEIFDLAVRIEENGEHFYRKAMDRVSKTSSLNSLLQVLAEEEVRHREWFLKMKKSAKSRDDAWAEQMSGALLQGAVDEHAFSLDEVDFSSIHDESRLLEVAIGLEEDSITFYEIIGSFVTDTETLEHLHEIIQEEHKHIKFLEQQQEGMGGHPLQGQAT